jgi:WD repeat-containing protein 48
MWLLEYLLVNKFPAVTTPKLSFIMLPWPSKDPNQMLPPLLNT